MQSDKASLFHLQRKLVPKQILEKDGMEVLLHALKISSSADH